MSDQVVGPPPSTVQIVVAIHNLEIQTRCLLAAVAVLASDARPEVITATAAAVRATKLMVHSPFYPGKEKAVGITEAAEKICEKIAELIESSARPSAQ